MVELLIALGVCAIGICSIMVLIPVGASATRDAALETYAAQAAEQLLNYLEYSATLSADSWSQTVVNDQTGAITETKPADSDYTIAELDDSEIWCGTIADNVYQRSENQSVYLIISHRNDDDDDIQLGDPRFPEKVDFRAILAVWKEQISVNGIEIPYESGVRLNVEVSWPAEIPYAARQKALYCLEVFNPNAQNEEDGP